MCDWTLGTVVFFFSSLYLCALYVNQISPIDFISQKRTNSPKSKQHNCHICGVLSRSRVSCTMSNYLNWIMAFGMWDTRFNLHNELFFCLSKKKIIEEITHTIKIDVRKKNMVGLCVLFSLPVAFFFLVLSRLKQNKTTQHNNNTHTHTHVKSGLVEMHKTIGIKC